MRVRNNKPKRRKCKILTYNERKALVQSAKQVGATVRQTASTEDRDMETGANAYTCAPAQSDTGHANRTDCPTMETDQTQRVDSRIPDWLSEQVQAQLTLRSTAGDQVPTMQRAAERYFYVLNETRNERIVERLFNMRELGLICDAVPNIHSFCLPPEDIWQIGGAVDEAIWHRDLPIKWGVDGEALVKKLDALDRLSVFALCDILEVFWMRGGWDSPLDDHPPDDQVTVPIIQALAQLQTLLDTFQLEAGTA